MDYKCSFNVNTKFGRKKNTQPKGYAEGLDNYTKEGISQKSKHDIWGEWADFLRHYLNSLSIQFKSINNLESRKGSHTCWHTDYIIVLIVLGGNSDREF